MEDKDLDYPQVDDKTFTERAGVLAFGLFVNNKLRCIWRETPNTDVGIDGHVEYVSADSRCLGHLIAVQVKSGNSYVSKGNQDEIHFYPEHKHVRYWQQYPIPVILVVYDTDKDCVYWIDARRYLKSPRNADSKAIVIPRTQILTPANKDRLFESAGPVGGRLLPLDEVIRAMAVTHTGRSDFDTSYLDLFALGLTDRCRKLLFSMSLCMNIAETRAPTVTADAGVHRFLDGYIDFLVSQNLVVFDYADYLIDRDENRQQPMVICPLTWRGAAVLEKLSQIERDPFHECLCSVDYADTRQRLDVLQKLQGKIASGELDDRLKV